MVDGLPCFSSRPPTNKSNLMTDNNSQPAQLKCWIKCLCVCVCAHVCPYVWDEY